MDGSQRASQDGTESGLALEGRLLRHAAFASGRAAGGRAQAMVDRISLGLERIIQVRPDPYAVGARELAVEVGLRYLPLAADPDFLPWVGAAGEGEIYPLVWKDWLSAELLRLFEEEEEALARAAWSQAARAAVARSRRVPKAIAARPAAARPRAAAQAAQRLARLTRRVDQVSGGLGKDLQKLARTRALRNLPSDVSELVWQASEDRLPADTVSALPADAPIGEIPPLGRVGRLAERLAERAIGAPPETAPTPPERAGESFVLTRQPPSRRAIARKLASRARSPYPASVGRAATFSRLIAARPSQAISSPATLELAGPAEVRASRLAQRGRPDLVTLEAVVDRLESSLEAAPQPARPSALERAVAAQVSRTEMAPAAPAVSPARSVSERVASALSRLTPKPIDRPAPVVGPGPDGQEMGVRVYRSTPEAPVLRRAVARALVEAERTRLEGLSAAGVSEYPGAPPRAAVAAPERVAAVATRLEQAAPPLPGARALTAALRREVASPVFLDDVSVDAAALPSLSASLGWVASQSDRLRDRTDLVVGPERISTRLLRDLEVRAERATAPPIGAAALAGEPRMARMAALAAGTPELVALEAAAEGVEAPARAVPPAAAVAPMSRPSALGATPPAVARTPVVPSPRRPLTAPPDGSALALLSTFDRDPGSPRGRTAAAVSGRSPGEVAAPQAMPALSGVDVSLPQIAAGPSVDAVTERSLPVSRAPAQRSWQLFGPTKALSLSLMMSGGDEAPSPGGVEPAAPLALALTEGRKALGDLLASRPALRDWSAATSSFGRVVIEERPEGVRAMRLGATPASPIVQLVLERGEEVAQEPTAWLARASRRAAERAAAPTAAARVTPERAALPTAAARVTPERAAPPPTATALVAPERPAAAIAPAVGTPLAAPRTPELPAVAREWRVSQPAVAEIMTASVRPPLALAPSVAPREARAAAAVARAPGLPRGLREPFALLTSMRRPEAPARSASVPVDLPDTVLRLLRRPTLPGAQPLTAAEPPRAELGVRPAVAPSRRDLSRLIEVSRVVLSLPEASATALEAAGPPSVPRVPAAPAAAIGLRSVQRLTQAAVLTAAAEPARAAAYPVTARAEQVLLLSLGDESGPGSTASVSGRALVQPARAPLAAVERAAQAAPQQWTPRVSEMITRAARQPARPEPIVAGLSAQVAARYPELGSFSPSYSLSAGPAEVRWMSLGAAPGRELLALPAVEPQTTRGAYPTATAGPAARMARALAPAVVAVPSEAAEPAAKVSDVAARMARQLVSTPVWSDGQPTAATRVAAAAERRALVAAGRLPLPTPAVSPELPPMVGRLETRFRFAEGEVEPAEAFAVRPMALARAPGREVVTLSEEVASQIPLGVDSARRSVQAPLAQARAAQAAIAARAGAPERPEVTARRAAPWMPAAERGQIGRFSPEYAAEGAFPEGGPRVGVSRLTGPAARLPAAPREPAALRARRLADLRARPSALARVERGELVGLAEAEAEAEEAVEAAPAGVTRRLLAGRIHPVPMLERVDDTTGQAMALTARLRVDRMRPVAEVEPGPTLPTVVAEERRAARLAARGGVEPILVGLVEAREVARPGRVTVATAPTPRAPRVVRQAAPVAAGEGDYPQLSQRVLARAEEPRVVKTLAVARDYVGRPPEVAERVEPVTARRARVSRAVAAAAEAVHLAPGVGKAVPRAEVVRVLAEAGLRPEEVRLATLGGTHRPRLRAVERQRAVDAPAPVGVLPRVLSRAIEALPSRVLGTAAATPLLAGRVDEGVRSLLRDLSGRVARQRPSRVAAEPGGELVTPAGTPPAAGAAARAAVSDGEAVRVAPVPVRTAPPRVRPSPAAVGERPSGRRGQARAWQGLLDLVGPAFSPALTETERRRSAPGGDLSWFERQLATLVERGALRVHGRVRPLEPKALGGVDQLLRYLEAEAEPEAEEELPSVIPTDSGLPMAGVMVGPQAAPVRPARTRLGRAPRVRQMSRAQGVQGERVSSTSELVAPAVPILETSMPSEPSAPLVTRGAVSVSPAAAGGGGGGEEEKTLGQLADEVLSHIKDMLRFEAWRLGRK